MLLACYLCRDPLAWCRHQARIHDCGWPWHGGHASIAGCGCNAARWIAIAEVHGNVPHAALGLTVSGRKRKFCWVFGRRSQSLLLSGAGRAVGATDVRRLTACGARPRTTARASRERAGAVQAAEHAERMESHGQHLHGAAEQLRHERDAALQERDAIAQERDAALQRSEEMLGDLKALLSKNQVRPCMRECMRA